MNIFPRKKNANDVEPTEELREVQKDRANVRSQSSKVDRLAEDLHKHLKENNFGARLYLEMVRARR